MADISITKYKTKVTKPTASPSNPGYPTSDPIDPVNPPASGAGGGGVNTFLQLTDTPASYTGQAGLFPKVNSGETGLEFFNPLSLPLTGYTVGSNTALASTDTILGAFGKVQGQIDAKIGGTIASGQVAFGTGTGTIGGDSGLFWNNTNKRFSIGTQTSLTTPLTVANSFGRIEFSALSGGQSYIEAFNSNRSSKTSLRLYSAGFSIFTSPLTGAYVERISVLTTGEVGIGTTSPTNTLDVNGTARIRTLSNATGDFVTASATGVLQKRTAAEVVSDLGISNLWTDGTTFIYRDGPVVVGRTTLPTNTTFAVQSKVSGSANVFQLISDSGSDLVQINNLGYYGFIGPDFVIGDVAASGSNFIYKSDLNGSNSTIFSIKDSLNVDIARWGANGNYYQKSERVNINNTTGVGFTYQGNSTSGGTKIFNIWDGAGAEKVYVKGDGGAVILNPRMSIGSASASVTNGVYIQGNSNTNQIFGLSNNSAIRVFDVYGNGNIGIYDSGNFILGTTTGTKIGTATSQKIGFWNATPIVQPTTAVTGATLVGGGGATITDTDTFDGYTLAQIVKALRNIGLLA